MTVVPYFLLDRSAGLSRYFSSKDAINCCINDIKSWNKWRKENASLQIFFDELPIICDYGDLRINLDFENCLFDRLSNEISNVLLHDLNIPIPDANISILNSSLSNSDFYGISDASVEYAINQLYLKWISIIASNISNVAISTINTEKTDLSKTSISNITIATGDIRDGKFDECTFNRMYLHEGRYFSVNFTNCIIEDCAIKLTKSESLYYNHCDILDTTMYVSGANHDITFYKCNLSDIKIYGYEHNEHRVHFIGCITNNLTLK